MLADPAAWLAAERSLLTGAVAQAARLGMAGYAWELTSALGQFLSTHRYTDAWQDCATRAVAAARGAGDARGEPVALLRYADSLGDAGRYGDAIRSVRRALALVAGSGDTEADAVCRTLMAVMRLLHGQAVRSDEEAQQALTLEALGQLHQERQQPAAAAPLIAEAQELWQALSVNARWPPPLVLRAKKLAAWAHRLPPERNREAWTTMS
jgi:hypothetical protein